MRTAPKTTTATAATPATGSAYVARTRLTDKAGAVLAQPGEACDRVPATSLPWLLEQGHIVPRETEG